MATLPKVDPAELHKLLQELLEGYVAEFAYVDTYKPKKVLWSSLRKDANQISD